MNKLENLESIIQTNRTDGGSSYQLRYEWQESVTVQVSLPCHTGNLTPNGKIAKSSVNRAIYTSNRVKNCDSLMSVTRVEAEAAGKWALENGRYMVKEYVGNRIIYRVARGES